MGRYVFKLPDVGEGTAEAEIVAWHVQVGEIVQEDAPLVDVMTDKATVEMTSPVTGRVTALVGEPGDMAPVGSVIVVLDVDGAAEGSEPITPPTLPEAAPVAAPVAASEAAEPHPRAPAPLGSVHGAAPPPSLDLDPAAGSSARANRDRAPLSTPNRAPGERPAASPAVRRRAEDLGVKLTFIPGSGPGGRIEHADLDAYLAASAAEAAPVKVRAALAPRTGVETVKVIGLRRRIAEKMQEAKRRIPHFAYVEEVDMTELEALRQHLNATHPDRPRLTVLPFFVRALVRILPAYPQINARFDDEAGVVHRHEGVHLGVATQTPNGLVVPVLRHAEALELWTAAAEVARLAEAARTGKAKSEELSGSTITLTSLGPLGGVATTPVINYPEVAIIGPNKIVDRPVVRNGQIVIRKMMNLSSSFDHRVVDGYDAAEFIQKVKAALEHPASLFVD